LAIIRNGRAISALGEKFMRVLLMPRPREHALMLFGCDRANPTLVLKQSL